MPRKGGPTFYFRGLHKIFQPLSLKKDIIYANYFPPGTSEIRMQLGVSTEMGFPHKVKYFFS